MIDFFLQTLELKDEKRTGWELRKIENPESVADHSWNTTFLTMIYGKTKEIDQEKAIKMALIHDLAESKTGDIVTRANTSLQEKTKQEKNELEEKAMKQLTKNLQDNEIKELWLEYEKCETPEAQFVKDMDLMDLCLQALKYEIQNRYNKNETNENFQDYDDLDEFFETSKNRINYASTEKLFEKIEKRYEQAKG